MVGGDGSVEAVVKGVLALSNTVSCSYTGSIAHQLGIRDISAEDTQYLFDSIIHIRDMGLLSE